jgi:hypothetical protein
MAGWHDAQDGDKAFSPSGLACLSPPGSRVPAVTHRSVCAVWDSVRPPNTPLYQGGALTRTGLPYPTDDTSQTSQEKLWAEG